MTWERVAIVVLALLAWAAIGAVILLVLTEWLVHP